MSRTILVVEAGRIVGVGPGLDGDGWFASGQEVRFWPGRGRLAGRPAGRRAGVSGPEDDARHAPRRAAVP